jgi:hypothetical protein
MSKLNNLLLYTLNMTIIEDHNKFLDYLFNLYGKEFNFTREELYNRYHINEIYLKEKINKERKKRKPAVIPELKDRCMARCWGGESSVTYNSDTNHWSFGVQCKRRHLSDGEFCGIHKKEIDNGYLTHGRIDEPVPHRHYEKFKIKIESKLKDNPG